jgi:hypothetical protein
LDLGLNFNAKKGKRLRVDRLPAFEEKARQVAGRLVCFFQRHLIPPTPISEGTHYPFPHTRKGKRDGEGDFTCRAFFGFSSRKEVKQ